MRKLMLYLFVTTLTFAMAPGLEAQKPKKKATAAAAKSPEAAPPTTASFPPGPVIDPVLLKNLKARSIGPAEMGGRVSDIAYDPRTRPRFTWRWARAG